MFTVKCGTACSVCRPDNPDYCLVCKQPGLLLQRGSCVTSCQDNFYVTRNGKCAGNILQILPLTSHLVVTDFGVKERRYMVIFCELVTDSWYYALFTFSIPPPKFFFLFNIQIGSSEKFIFQLFFFLGWFEQMHLLKLFFVLCDNFGWDNLKVV